MKRLRYKKLSIRERRDLREEYIKHQNGLCHYCKGYLSEEAPRQIRQRPINETLFPRGFFNNPVHLHHSHTTGLTIGAVHCHCNAILWQYHGE